MMNSEQGKCVEAGVKQPASELHKAALEYASKGFAVFPLKPNTKKKLFGNGVNDATKMSSVINDWWAKEPFANIGLSTSGLIVLDVDTKDGIDGLQSLQHLVKTQGSLPDTLTQLTPSGGIHYIFRNTSGRHVPSRVNCPAKGIDSRGNSGYIVAEPSVIDKSTYVMSKGSIANAPEWLCNLIITMPLNLGVQAGSVKGGARKRFLFDVARECCRNGLTPEQVQKKLKYANLKCEPLCETQDLDIFCKIATSRSFVYERKII